MAVIVELDRQLKAVAPIFGVSIGRFRDKSSWRIDFLPEATAAERTSAQDVLDVFDVTAEEQKIADAETARVAALDRLRTLPDEVPVTAGDLKAAGLI